MKKIYLISLLSIFSLNLFCQVHWTKYAGNPLMLPGELGEWDEETVAPEAILYLDSTYHMWYCGGRFLENTAIGYATSTDGIYWTKHTSIILFWMWVRRDRGTTGISLDVKF